MVLWVGNVIVYLLSVYVMVITWEHVFDTVDTQDVGMQSTDTPSAIHLTTQRSSALK